MVVGFLSEAAWQSTPKRSKTIAAQRGLVQRGAATNERQSRQFEIRAPGNAAYRCAILFGTRPVTTWEYRIETVKGVFRLRSKKLPQVQTICKDLGRQGWELVSVTYHWLVVQYVLYLVVS